MDTERLAAYLGGELDADETAALEAALVRDPRLRAELDAMRRADAALGALPPTELPVGFEVRLRDALDEQLSTVLRPDGGTVVPGTGESDELSVRRARRTRGWVPALAGAAAAVAVIAGAVVGVGVLGAGDEDTAAGDMDTAMTLESFDADDAGDAIPPPGEGPTVVVGDRELDDGLADELLASLELQTVTDRGLDADDGRSLGASWRAALASLAPPVMMTDDAEAAPETEADQAETDEAEAPLDDATRILPADVPIRLLGDGLPSDADLADVERCLDEVLAADADAIPAYLELASFDGEDVVVVGLITFDPATGAYTRPEVWVLAREDCQVRRFSQG